MDTTDGNTTLLDGNTTQLNGCVEETLVPFVGEVLHDGLTSGERALYGCAITATVIITLITFARFCKDRPPYHNVHIFRSHTVLVMLPWVIAAFNLSGVIVPRSLVLVGLVQNVYFSYSLAQFVGLMVELLGGRDTFLKKVVGEEMNLGRAVPGCGICCKKCLPTPAYNESRHIRLHFLIAQYCVLQPLISFIAAVLGSNGNYTEGYVSQDNAYIYVKCIQVGSMLLAFYSLTIIKLMVEGHLQSYNIGHKFLQLKAIMLLTNLQSLVFGILARFDVFVCTQYFSKATRSSYIFSFTLIFEMLALACYTVFVVFPFNVKMDRLTTVKSGSESGVPLETEEGAM